MTKAHGLAAMALQTGPLNLPNQAAGIHVSVLPPRNRGDPAQNLRICVASTSAAAAFDVAELSLLFRAQPGTWICPPGEYLQKNGNT